MNMLTVLRKKLVSFFMLTSLTCTTIAGVQTTSVSAKESTKKATPTTATEIVRELKAGWNLGNSLDAVVKSHGYTLDSETLWNNPKVTKELIQSVKKNGFSSIRIPVTYYNHIDSNGVIDQRWLARVKEVVDYATDEDMYAIINVHHDAGLDRDYRWIYSDEATYETDKKNLTNLWSQIATYFKDADEKLLFESTNEIMDKDEHWGWDYKENFKVTAKLHNDFIKTVRKTGGKNADRFLVLPTYAACPDEEEIRQILNYKYDDTCKDHLIMSVHCYRKDEASINTIMDRLGKYSKEYNVPVIMDEFGTKSDLPDSQRASIAKKYVDKALKYNIGLFWWDNGSDYGLFDRHSAEVTHPEIVKELVTPYKSEDTSDPSKDSPAKDETNKDSKDNKDSEDTESTKESDSKSTESIPGIACWGDSITFGYLGDGVTYPNVLKDNLYKKGIDIPVINLGSCGETSISIAARSGGIKMVTTKNLTIPASTTPVDVDLLAEDGKKLNVMIYNDNVGVNECELCGVKGTLRLKVSQRPEYGYTFTRSKSGKAVSVAKGSVLTPYAANHYKDYINVVFIGTNGGYDNYEDLVKQQKAIINSRTKNTDKYLIVGMYCGGSDYFKAYDELMEKTYGDKYFNLREYLSKNGLKDAGLSPTDEDLKFISWGMVPKSLRFDDAHLTSTGYRVVGNAIYNKLDELGYFDDSKKDDSDAKDDDKKKDDSKDKSDEQKTDEKKSDDSKEQDEQHDVIPDEKNLIQFKDAGNGILLNDQLKITEKNTFSVKGTLKNIDTYQLLVHSNHIRLETQAGTGRVFVQGNGWSAETNHYLKAGQTFTFTQSPEGIFIDGEKIADVFYNYSFTDTWLKIDTNKIKLDYAALI